MTTTQNLQTFATWLPVFSGFYNTVWDESDRYVEYELDDEADFRRNYPELDAVSWEFIRENFWDVIDYASASRAVAKAALEALPRILPDDMVTATEFEELRSPREYNFTNDSVNCKITVDLDLLHAYLKEHRDKLEHYLATHYSSRSGFISSYPNDLEQWEDDTAGWTDLGGHYLGALLNFVAHNEDKEPEYALYEAAGACEVFSNNANVDTARLLAKWQEVSE
jgi:hypothetical protein